MPRHGFNWSQEDLQKLVELRAQGFRVAEIAKAIGCTFNQVGCKIQQIGTKNLPTPFRRKIRWDEEMLDTLVHLRRKGYSYQECADEIGVDQMVVARKCLELGLNQRMNCGAIRGTERKAK